MSNKSYQESSNDEDGSEETIETLECLRKIKILDLQGLLEDAPELKSDQKTAKSLLKISKKISNEDVLILSNASRYRKAQTVVVKSIKTAKIFKSEIRESIYSGDTYESCSHRSRLSYLNMTFSDIKLRNETKIRGFMLVDLIKGRPSFFIPELKYLAKNEQQDGQSAPPSTTSDLGFHYRIEQTSKKILLRNEFYGVLARSFLEDKEFKCKDLIFDKANKKVLLRLERRGIFYRNKVKSLEDFLAEYLRRTRVGLSTHGLPIFSQKSLYSRQEKVPAFCFFGDLLLRDKTLMSSKILENVEDEVFDRFLTIPEDEDEEEYMISYLNFYETPIKKKPCFLISAVSKRRDTAILALLQPKNWIHRPAKNSDFEDKTAIFGSKFELVKRDELKIKLESHRFLFQFYGEGGVFTQDWCSPFSTFGSNNREIMIVITESLELKVVDCFEFAKNSSVVRSYGRCVEGDLVYVDIVDETKFERSYYQI